MKIPNNPIKPKKTYLSKKDSEVIRVTTQVFKFMGPDGKIKFKLASQKFYWDNSLVEKYSF